MNRFSSYITLQTVRLDVSAASRKRLFEEASALFEVAYGISHSEVFDALIARERLGSTCVGAGCALPHGRLPELEEPALVFLRTAEPVSLDSPDGRGVRLFFCLLVPENDEKDYLGVLREIACLLSQKPMRQALLDAADDVAVCELLHAWEPPTDLHASAEAADALSENEDVNDETPRTDD